MKLFKRGFAMLLACMMLVMAIPFGGLSVYADVATLVEGADAYNTISVTAGERGYAYFTPETTGYYTYYSVGSADVVGCAWRAEDEYGLGEDDDGGESNNFSLQLFLQAGVLYRFEAWYWGNSNSGDIQVYVVPQEFTTENLPGLKCGESATAELDGEGGYDYFVFTAEKDGYYAFYSISDADTYGVIENVWSEELASDDDGGNDWNFRVVYYMTAGETYRLGARYLSDNSGSFTVCLEEYYPHLISDVVFQDITIASYELQDYGDYPQPRLTVFFADGTSEEFNGYYICDDNGGYDVEVSYDIWYGEWYAGGSYNAYAEVVVGDHTFSGSFIVNVEESPILRVEVKNPQHIVNYGGWDTYDNNWDEETGEYVRTPQYRYYPTEPEQVTIYMKDGSVYENGYVDWNGFNYWINYNNPIQNYENQWGVGNHTVQGTILGYTFTYDVEILESPIASIEYQPIQLVQEAGGYWRDAYYWDNDLQEYVERYYYYYYLDPIATVTMKDGTVYENVSWFNWNNYESNVFSGYEQYRQPLQLGTNYIHGSVLGYDFEVAIEVIDTPIASIEFDPVTVMEYSNGYWNEGTYWDDELQEDVPYSYYYYYVYPRATITMKDGTVYEDVGGLEWGDRWYSLSNFQQDWNNPLQLGTNYVTGKYLGYDYILPIVVEESPIASVVVPERMLVENSNGYWTTGWYYDENGDYQEGEYFVYHNYGPQNATITLKDGTVYEGVSGFYWNDQWYGLSYGGQSYENQILPGRNERWFSIMGYEGTYVLNVVDTPVASVEVSAPISLVENQNGYWDYTSYWDEELQEDVYVEFFYYYNSYIRPTVTITLKDGTVHTLDKYNTSLYWGGRWYELELQSQYNGDYLRPGTNIRTASILGYNFEYEVSVNSLNSNESFEYMEAEDYVIITDCYVTDETVEIPAAINGKPVIGVTSLSSAWSTLKHLILPDSVVTIGDYLLSGLENLESVHFGAGVSNLTAEMFGYCWNLQSITISEDNPYYCVANNGLHNKTLDTLIAYPSAGENRDYLVPTTVVNIDVLDWYSVYNRVNVIFPDDHIAFVTVDGVTYNKEMTVVISCHKDKTGEYVMPETVEEIAAGAFMNSDLTSVVVSPKVTEIVYCAFASCANLESVILPEGLVSIEMHAFDQTESLREINLPDTLEYIGNYSFYKSGLTALSVPDSVTVIDSSAFNESKIEVLDLGNGLQILGESAFANTLVGSVVLPDSLTDMGSAAFYNCGALSSVTFGSGLTRLNTSVFARTPSLMNITIPGTIVGIEGGAFGRSGLMSLTLSEGTRWIDGFAFNGCSNLKAVHIPASTSYVASTAFNGCNSLTTLTVEDGNETYYSSDNCIISHSGQLVVGCSTSFVPSSVTSIIYYSFQYCETLTSIELPITVTAIGEDAFNGCYNLTDVYYQGTEMDRDNIYIDWGNDYLLNATWHYNWVNENWDEIPVCDHEYDSVCDSDCNLCGAFRRAPHAYENACAEWCLYCKEWREPADHIYDNACDDTCNECGAMRAVTAHWYDNACDASCNECGAWREVPAHWYDNACDYDCNECYAIRNVSDHVYDNKYDADCNECGSIRQAASPVILSVDNATVRPGDTFQVAVRIDNNTGLAGFRFDVVYDEAQFELLDAVAGVDFSTATYGPVQSPFNVLWYDFLSPNNTANGVIVTLTFRAKEEAVLGSFDIEIVPYADDFLDDQMEPVRYETVSGTVSVVESTPGDVDGDGKVNVRDLGIVQRYLNGWGVELDLTASDVNGDGKINIRDLGLLQQYLNGWDVELK